MSDNKTNTRAARANEHKSNTTAGISSALGAMIGTFGTMSVQDALAAENPVILDPIDPEPIDPNPIHQTPEKPEEPAKIDNPHKPDTPETPDKPVTPPEDIVEPPVTEPEVQVLSYETVATENGNVDMALVSVNDQVYLVADADQDGFADVIGADINGDGNLSPEELQPIDGQELPMQPLHEAYLQGQTAQNEIDGPDYVNTANVDDYMA